MAFKKIPPNGYTIYTFNIPSLGIEKRFRPFLVKESKALMIANGTDDNKVMIETLKQVVQNACLDADLDVDELSVFDFEYLLIRLRAISISDPIDIELKCDGEDHRDGIAPALPVAVDLNNVEVYGIDNESKKIDLGDNRLVVMRYPDLEVLDLLNQPKDTLDYVQIIAKCIDQLVIGDEIYERHEIELNDLKEWIETLDNANFLKIVNFFDDLPYTRVKVEFDCPSCGKHNVRYIVGLKAFF